MCEWGNTKEMVVTVPAGLSHTDKTYQKLVGIDSCIYNIVKALNEGGVYTDACCCGHGKRPGDIILGDGRELIIAQNYEIARKVDEAFPPIN